MAISGITGTRTREGSAMMGGPVPVQKPGESFQAYQDRIKQLTDQYNSDSAADQAAGDAFAAKHFGTGYLGRLDTSRPAETQNIIDSYKKLYDTSGISPEMNDVLARRRAALGGFSSEENNALRSQMAQQNAQGFATANRNLRGIQANNGIHGGLASAQRANLANQAMQNDANNAQNLFIQNIQQKQNALNALEGSQTGAERDAFTRTSTALGGLGSATGSAQDRERAATIYNNSNAGTEAQQQAAAALGFMGIGSAGRAGIAEQALGEFGPNGPMGTPSASPAMEGAPPGAVLEAPADTMQTTGEIRDDRPWWQKIFGLSSPTIK